MRFPMRGGSTTLSVTDDGQRRGGDRRQRTMTDIVPERSIGLTYGFSPRASDIEVDSPRLRFSQPRSNTATTTSIVLRTRINIDQRISQRGFRLSVVLSPHIARINNACLTVFLGGAWQNKCGVSRCAELHTMQGPSKNEDRARPRQIAVSMRQLRNGKRAQTDASQIRSMSAVSDRDDRKHHPDNARLERVPK